MILVLEMTWTGSVHAPLNGAMIQTVARAFPTQEVRVLADPTHLDELRRRPALLDCGNVALEPIALSPLFRGRTHIVSARRFARELATIRGAVGDAPGGEPCLLLLLSATPTAIFAARLAARLAHYYWPVGGWPVGGWPIRPRRRIGVQVCLHGNLNEIDGWRPRNPLTRRFDLAAALAAPQPPHLRYLLLEQPIREALIRLLPGLGPHVDVLPHPVDAGEAVAAAGSEDAGPPDCPRPSGADEPVRIGFVGQGTEAKGFSTFLALAAAAKARHGRKIAFHHVGHVPDGTDPGVLAALAEPSSPAHLDRATFLRRLARLDYVILPFRESYYNLSASGALTDALNWRKPVIATAVPLSRAYFDQFGDIGYLCEVEHGLGAAIDAVLAAEPARYAAQLAALAQARASRAPQRLAATYRALTEAGFPGLLA